ncbi:MAG: energy transducer TonB [Terriglobales bacterium]|jgi:periplasmic protein TonB
MFSTLESTWDQSARRGWTTLASFTMQALALSLLFAVSLIWIERPPQVRWLQLTAPAAFTPPAAEQPASGHHTVAAVSNPRSGEIVAPRWIARQIATSDDSDSVPAAPDFSSIGTGPGRGPGDGVPHSIGDGIPLVIPARPAVVKPLLVSHLAEANLLHKVQPSYPTLARQAHVQGTVELRAIISKAGTIENLVVVRGHPMLAPAAIDAVRQWRYRPYLLNNEPIEVETEITVNFVLSGS